MEEIDKFETKIKNLRELITDTIEHDYEKVINDLNIEKELETKNRENRNKTREKKLSKTIADTIRKSVISENFLHQPSIHRRYCA